MGKSAHVRPGDKIGNWRLEEVIGAGGNGTVWRVSRAGQPDRALKLLRKLSRTTWDRLSAEIDALKMADGVAGIVPLLDHDIHRDPEKGPRWFVMPLAKSAAGALSGRCEDVVRRFIPLAQTLADLHGLGIHHRDIKPANLLVLDGRLCFSDFGLVKYPARKDITPERGDVGPKFTMAPEMRREAARAAGAPADVYSFAKTLWIALSGESRGFDGQYSADGVLAISRQHPGVFSAPLDELLAECTDNDPEARPVMSAVAGRLRHWLELEEDYHRRNLVEWIEVQRRLFPFGAPAHARWEGTEEICAVLRRASRDGSVNHMFMPNGGGMAIENVLVDVEPGFIRLDAGLTFVLKPEKLTFESFGAGSRWNYFRLEAESVGPTETPGNYVSSDGYYEALCELAPGRYVTPDAWENGEYRGEALPAGAQPITRYLKGSFVIVSTRSDYNLTPATYDARHERLGETSFREYIGRQAARAAEREKFEDADVNSRLLRSRRRGPSA